MQERARLITTCERRETAIGVPFSCNNIYHQSFHAVPAWEHWREMARIHSRKADGADVDYLPLIYPSAAVGKKMSVDPRKWHAWEFSIRPYTSRPYEELAARTAQLLRPGSCVCYDRVFANAPAFNPIARRSASRMRAFRAAALLRSKPFALAGGLLDMAASIAGGITAPSSARTILWVVRRHALRNINNDGQLAARVQADAQLASRIRRVELERMALSEQMHLFAGASALLAVHGQAMAWVLFLPSGERRTAAVEIFPVGLRNPIYQELSTSLGTRYESLKAATAPGCGDSHKVEARLMCNVTVNVEKVVRAVESMARWTAAG